MSRTHTISLPKRILDADQLACFDGVELATRSS